MVNKHIQRARFLRPLFFIALITASLITPSQTEAQKISNYYTSHFQENGTLYFIKAKHLFENKSLKSSFVFDITYPSQSDSVTFNFSYFDKSLRKIDSIAWESKHNLLKSKTSILFTEPDKKLWEHRYSCTIAFVDLQSLFAKKTATLHIYCSDADISLTAKTKNWDKQSHIVSQILQMIVLNK